MTLSRNIIEAERGTEVPDGELPAVGVIRRRWLRGEHLDARALADEMGVHNSVASVARKSLTDLGFDFGHELYEPEGYSTGPRSHRWWITNLDHDPFAKPDVVADSGSVMAVEVKAAPVEAPVHSEQSAAALPALPDLGQHLRVYALVMNDDESITIGIRNGTRKWTATVTALIEA